MTGDKKKPLFPSIRIVTLDHASKAFESPLGICYTDDKLCSVKYIPPICTCDKHYIEICSCDLVFKPRLRDCSHCKCDCDHCHCDCDHCRCDCDFCNCVSKGGLSPEQRQVEEACQAHCRTFFKLAHEGSKE